MLRSAEVKPLFYRFVRLSKVGRLLSFFDFMPSASGPVSFELWLLRWACGKKWLEEAKDVGNGRTLGNAKGAIVVFDPVAFESCYRTLSLGQALREDLGTWKEMAEGLGRNCRRLGNAKGRS